MYSNEYPYTNFHDINLDWVLEKTKECVEKVGAVESVAQQAQNTAKTAQTASETAQSEAERAAQTATQALEKAGNVEAEVGSATQAAAAATQAATEATQAAQNATNTAAAAQTAAESAQAAAQAAAADAQTAAGSVSEFDGRITAANNTANQAKSAADTAQSTADTAQSTATAAKNTADTNTAAISGIQTKLGGIAKMYNITVGTTWTSGTGYVTQEIAVDSLVPGVVNIFDLDLQPEQLASAADYLSEWAKIIKCETQSGHVNIYATEATTLQLNIVLGVVTNG